MKKKIVFLIYIVSVLTGCTANYTLEINKDLSLKEMIVITENNRLLQNEYPSLDLAIDARVAQKRDAKGYGLYRKENIISEENSGIKITRIYSEFDSYSENYFIKYLFEKPTFVNKKGLVTIRYRLLYDKGVFTDEPFDVDFYVTPININVIIPFKLIDGNYENYDKATGAMSWAYTYDNIPNELWFKMDTNVLADGGSVKKEANNYNYLYILFLIPVIIIGVYIYIKYKKANEM